MMPTRKPKGTPLLILSLLAAMDRVTTGEPPSDADIDHAWHMMMCEFCAKGVPLENGKHKILDVEFDCDAEPPTEAE